MEKKNINRRDFIKIVGISTATVSGLFYGRPYITGSSG